MRRRASSGSSRIRRASPDPGGHHGARLVNVELRLVPVLLEAQIFDLVEGLCESCMQLFMRNSSYEDLEFWTSGCQNMPKTWTLISQGLESDTVLGPSGSVLHIK